MADEYLYPSVLEDQTIRLLELQSGAQSDELTVVLSIARLSDCPRYEALSYEWGRDRADEPVICAGKKIPITQNLLIALKHFRRLQRSRTLWIDAICINQNDITEKNTQVSLMRNIYAQAQSVLVWLGPESHRTSDAFQMLSILARSWIVREVSKARTREERPLSWAEPSSEEASCLGKKDSSLWAAVYEIFERTYFSRTWVIQEIAVARAPRVLCGHLEISWQRLSWAAAYVGHSLHHLHESPSDKGLARIGIIANLRSEYQKGKDIDVYLACVYSQAFNATDGRDKVFGLLGLINSRKRTSSLQNLLEVDYCLPVRTVYYRAAQKSILKDQSLRICHCQTFTKKNIKDLPSWAPDWSTFSEESPTLALRLHNYLDGGMRKTISFISDTMHVDSRFVDTVAYTTTKLSSECPLPDIQKIIAFLASSGTSFKTLQDDEMILGNDVLDQMIQNLQQKIYRSRESMYEALWRTLIANTAQFITAKSDFEQHFDAIVDSLRLRARGIFWEKTRACDDMSMDELSIKRLKHDKYAQILYIRIQAQDSGPYFRELVNTIERRLFFVTKMGYIGIGSQGTTVGDRIAILKGGWSPFVLEPCQNFYRMKGDAYVHGLEPMKLRDGSKPGITSIKIK